MSRYRRGDVWLASYDPTMGSEVEKPRPMAVVSPDEMNDRVKSVIVVPFSGRASRAPWRTATNFANRTGQALCDQVRSVSTGRLIRPLGRLDEATLDAILATLREAFSA